MGLPLSPKLTLAVEELMLPCPCFLLLLLLLLLLQECGSNDEDA